MMQTCPRCGTDQEDTARYCRFCGHKLKKNRLPLIVGGVAAAAVVLVGAVSLLSGGFGDSDTQVPDQMQSGQQTEQPAQTTLPQGDTLPETVGSTYEVFYENCTWQQAFDRCVQMGGSLVTFETEEEYQKVLSQLDTKRIYYIGAGRAEDSDSYYWVNADRTLSGTTLDGSAHWLDGEPSLSEGDVGEYYVNLFYVRKQGRWVWNDIPNDTIAAAPNYQDKIGYICEFQ